MFDEMKKENKTRELIKIDEIRSLIERTKPSGAIEYIVCSYYDSTKPFGSQWSWGHYFTNLNDAMLYASGYHEEINALKDKVKDITEKCNRYKTIASNAIDLGQLDEKFNYLWELCEELGCDEDDFFEITRD